MAKAVKPDATAQVDLFIQQLDPSLAAAVQALRQLILESSNSVGEHIKWNNPAFYYTEAIKDYDPKTYGRDMAVFNLHKGRLMLVFPSGADLEDPQKLLEGDYKDGRRLIIFKDIADVHLKAAPLQAIIKRWVKRIRQHTKVG